MPQTTTHRSRTQRLRLGLTLRELAAKCEDAGVPVDFSQLARIERGESEPRPALRRVLADLLELDVTDFELDRADTAGTADRAAG